MNNKGFTLIEFLIYIAISGIVVGTLTLTIVNVLEHKIRLTVIEEINRSSRFMTENISYVVRNASSANVSGDQLSLSYELSSHDPTLVYVDDENMMLQRGEESAVQLNGSYTKVKDFIISVEDQSFVTIAVTLDYTGERYSSERDFRIVENLRK